MRTLIRRRLEALEVVADQDELIDWGPGCENWQPMTMREFRRMLDEIHRSGAGRLKMIHLSRNAEPARAVP